jgi:hypothetical protein
MASFPDEGSGDGDGTLRSAGRLRLDIEEEIRKEERFLADRIHRFGLRNLRDES